MGKQSSYTIGEFSKRTNVSIRTLHYYDDIGLLQPQKHPSSGHRIYADEDVLTLHKIITLKFLGYRLEKIGEILHEPSYTVDLNETLNLHLQALEEKKVQMEASIAAIKRTSKLLEAEGEIDSSVLMSLISNMQTERIQMEWMKEYLPDDMIDILYNKTAEEKLALEKEFVQFYTDIKKLAGEPIDSPEVQKLMQSYIQFSFPTWGRTPFKYWVASKWKKRRLRSLKILLPHHLQRKKKNG
ncbi:MerR family transcriptional regulator [Lentibacillus sp.]|uniref:MerR family transcriptional regulator n=1 Tax=Lentibacillus sp. TaxID=1925746 RepID=UPI002B4AEEBB|nr:MerR family transcriptional regulator [Lentibacillus sp.]HLS09065.1 MerR family transcriptional regulator [Lentibacillus sp.]